MTSSERLEALINTAGYRVLLQIGLLGAEIGNAQATIQITDGLMHVRPDLPQAHAVHAMAVLKLDQHDDAIRDLETALERFPDFQLGTALLGMCMKLGGRSGWQHYLESVIEDGRDEFAVGLACELLGRPREQAVRDDGNVSNPRTDGSSGGYAVWA